MLPYLVHYAPLEHLPGKLTRMIGIFAERNAIRIVFVPYANGIAARLYLFTGEAYDPLDKKFLLRFRKTKPLD